MRLKWLVPVYTYHKTEIDDDFWLSVNAVLDFDRNLDLFKFTSNLKNNEVIQIYFYDLFFLQFSNIKYRVLFSFLLVNGIVWIKKKKKKRLCP